MDGFDVRTGNIKLWRSTHHRYKNNIYSFQCTVTVLKLNRILYIVLREANAVTDTETVLKNGLFVQNSDGCTDNMRWCRPSQFKCSGDDSFVSVSFQAAAAAQEKANDWHKWRRRTQTSTLHCFIPSKSASYARPDQRVRYSLKKSVCGGWRFERWNNHSNDDYYSVHGLCCIWRVDWCKELIPTLESWVTPTATNIALPWVGYFLLR